MDLDNQKIVARLLDIGRQSDSEGLFPTFEPKASKLIHESPYAFCMAVCLDRGTKADLIWTIPYWLKQSLGHLDPLLIDRMPIEQLVMEVIRLPKKPRYVNAAPYTIQSLTRLVVDKFHGDAELLWKNRRSFDVRKDLLSVYGVGPGIASMGVLLIEKGFGIRFSDLDHTRMDIKPDVHTMRVLYRLGVSAAEQEDEAVSAARYLNPSFPGELDAALWLLGRTSCNASNPQCNTCPMDDLCPKIDNGRTRWN